jgi:hypothetical protein
MYVVHLVCRDEIQNNFNLEIRIITLTMRGPWYVINKAVDSDTTNFKDLVAKIVDEFPCGYSDIVKLFYFCADSKSNIQIHSDQDLMHMFAKHMSFKCCCMSIAYHKPDVDPPEIPLWDNVDIPCTPSMPAPSHVEPSQATQTGTATEPDDDMVDAKDNYPMNPEPENEHVGVDEEGLYLDIAPASHANVDTTEEKDEDYDLGSNSKSDLSDSDMDDEVNDRLSSDMPQVAYNKDDPSMEVGSIYPNMSEFKLALATHAIKKEFEYNIEKSEPRRYRAYCAGVEDGWKWRLHASTMRDKVVVQVISFSFIFVVCSYF